MTTGKNNILNNRCPPCSSGAPSGETEDVVFTSCSRCFPINTQAIRSKILDLAMRGKLTEQLSEDGTAEALYRQFQEKKQALIQTGKSKKGNPLPKIEEDEIPFAIPKNWKWIRLNDLGIFCGGKTPSMANHSYWKNGSITWVTSKDMKQKYIHASEMMIAEEASRELTLLPAGTVLFVVRSGILRRLFPVAILKTNGTINQDLKALQLFVPEMCEFVYCLLKCFESTILFKYTKDGTTVNNIVFDSFLTMPVPLPPPAEQRRIVEKIDQAFSALDTIDALQAQYADNLTVLKSKLIDAAIQGKLTEQLPEDGTAEELYQQIQAERQRQEAADVIKAVELAPDIPEAEKPFVIPSNWKWTNLGNVSYIVRGGSPRPIKQYITTREDGINWIKIGDVEKRGKYIYSTHEKIIPEGVARSRRVYPGDFLLTNSMSFGRPYISTIEGCIHDGWLLIHNLAGFDQDYLYYLLSSTYLYGQFTEKASGSTVENLNIDKVKTAIIPLPPLAEQKRIVAKLDEVLKMIGQTPPRALGEKN
ncbi:MAG: restriction endonuclease subunit S [Kiritimatiellae bacterium]|nr:restriction endonuclease subunit S [Kiritimatiellia bacterium]